MKRLFIFCVIALSLIADNSEQFLANAGAPISKESAIRAASEEGMFEPFRTPPKFITIYVYPWENKDGDAIGETLIRAKLNDGKWVMTAPNDKRSNESLFSVQKAK
jgi:hypothetical protein